MPRRFSNHRFLSEAATSIAAAVVILFGASTAFAASIKSSVGKDGRINIELQGEIVEGDSDAFIELVKRANATGRYVANVRLNSMGGNLLEGAKLADAIRTAKLATNVGRAAVCASACFLAFAAGAEKNASYGAQIGVHGASDQSGRETVQSGAATVSMARIARDLGVPSGIIGKMVVTPPSEMVWLSPQDLQAMNVTMIGKPVQTAQPGAQGTGVQQLPGGPVDLSPPGAPQAKAPSAAAPTWSNMVEKAIAVSARQNNGKPLVDRLCQPETKTCTIAISFVLKDGRTAFVKTTENMHGKIISRESCELNDFNDVRTCLDWDNGTSHRDMKNTKGEWYKVADE